MKKAISKPYRPSNGSEGETMKTYEIVKKIIHEYLNVGPWTNIENLSDLKLEHHIVDDLGADSLDQIELLMAFEEAFGIEISDEEAERIKTVGDCVEYANVRFGPNN